MRNTGFLKKLARERKIMLVEPSKDLARAHVEKAQECHDSAMLLRKNGFFQNTIIMSYYAMYNSITSVLYTNGIRSTNHTGTIMLFELLYNEKEMCEIIIGARKSRVESQYSAKSHNKKVMGRLSEESVTASEMIIIKAKTIIQANTQDDIKQRRKILLQALIGGKSK